MKNKPNFNYLLILLFQLIGCASATKVYIESIPPKAELYSAIVKKGPWKIVTKERTPTTIKIYPTTKGKYFIKAKKYGYYDSELITIEEIARYESFKFVLDPVQTLYKNYSRDNYEYSLLHVKIPSEKKKNVAILNFKSIGTLDNNKAILFTKIFQDVLIKANIFNVIERENLKEILNEQQFQLTGITNNKNLVEIGKVANVKFLIIGSAHQVKDTYVLSVKIIDVENGHIIFSDKNEFDSLSMADAAIVKMVNNIVRNFVDIE